MSMNQDIRELFAAHAASDEEHFKQIAVEIKELRELIKPMADNFNAATTLGKWGWRLLILISVLVGIVVSVKSGFLK